MRCGAQIRGRDPSARIDTEVGSHVQWLDWVATPFPSVFGSVYVEAAFGHHP